MLTDQVQQIVVNLNVLLQNFAKINVQQDPNQYDYYYQIIMRQADWLLRVSARRNVNLPESLVTDVLNKFMLCVSCFTPENIILAQHVKLILKYFLVTARKIAVEHNLSLYVAKLDALSYQLNIRNSVSKEIMSLSSWPLDDDESFLALLKGIDSGNINAVEQEARIFLEAALTSSLVKRAESMPAKIVQIVELSEHYCYLEMFLRIIIASAKENLELIKKLATAIYGLAKKSVSRVEYQHVLLRLWDVLSQDSYSLTSAFGANIRDILVLISAVQAQTVDIIAADSDSVSYKKVLAKLRSNFISQFTGSAAQFWQAQRNFNVGIESLFKKIIQDAKINIGLPEHRLCFLTIGSLSRKDMLPYSDLEYALVQDPQNEIESRYTDILMRLISFKVRCIGEHGIGLHLDDGGHPGTLEGGDGVDPASIRLRLRGSAKELLTRCVEPEKGSIDLPDVKPSFQLYHAAYLCGDEDLWQEYEQELSEMLERQHKVIATDYIQMHTQALTKSLNTVDEFNIKDSLAGPLLYFIYDVNLYSNPKSSAEHPLILLDKLADKNILAKAFTKSIASALYQAQSVRAKEQLRLKQQLHKEIITDEQLITSFIELQTKLLKPAYKHLEIADKANKNLSDFNPLELDFNYLLISDFAQDIIILLNLLQSILQAKPEEPEIYYGKITNAIQTLRQRVSVLGELCPKDITTNYKEQLQALQKWLYTLNYLWQEQQDEYCYWIEISTKQLAIGNDIRDALEKNKQEQLHALRINELNDYLTAECKQAILINYIQFLISNHDDHNIYVKYYKLLPNKWKQGFWEILSRCFPQEKPEELLSIRLNLDRYPCKDGYRPTTMLQETSFEQGLDGLLTEVAVNPIGCRIITKTEIKSGFLVAEVSEQLKAVATSLQNRGPESSSANHLVIRVEYQGKGYYFKFYPEFPGIEMAVVGLHELVLGHGTEKGVLAKITIEDKAYPVLISLEVKGERLDESLMLNSNPELDINNYARLILMSLLIQPEDGKPANFILNSGKLISVDNDHAFGNPVIEATWSNWSYKLWTKTVLFCFDKLKQPLVEEVITEFLSLDARFILDKWLADLYAYETTMQQGKVFADEEVTSWSRTKIDKSYYHKKSVISFQLPVDLVSNLYQRFTILQRLLSRNPEITPLELLDNLDIRLGEYYRELLTSSLYLTVKSRFEKIEQDYYDQGKTTTMTKDMVSNVYNAKIQPHHIVEKKEYQSALETNRAYLNSISWQFDHILWLKEQIEGVADGWRLLINLHPGLRIKIINKLHWSRVEVKSQVSIFAKVLTDQEMVDVTTKLCLRDCQGLTTKLLKKLLADKINLQVLCVEGCDNLEEIILLTLPFLSRIKIKSCNSVKLINLSKHNINLSKLKALEVLDCPLLDEVSLLSLVPVAKNLKLIKLDDDVFTPLHIAARNNVIDVLEQYLKTGVDMNVVTKKNRTALHLAVLNQHYDAARLLFNRITFAIKDIDGKNAIDIFEEMMRHQLITDHVVKQEFVNLFYGKYYISYFDGDIFEVKVIILGSVGCGKSNLLTRICYNQYVELSPQTIGVDFFTLFPRGSSLKLKIWDTAGAEKYRTITSSYLRGTDIFLLMFDLTNYSSLLNCQGLKHDIERYSNSDQIIRIIVGSKLDLSKHRQVSYTQAIRMTRAIGGDAYYEVSAKTAAGIPNFKNALFDFAYRGIYSGHFMLGLPLEKQQKHLQSGLSASISNFSKDNTFFQQVKSHAYKYKCNILFFGAADVGKTSLINGIAEHIKNTSKDNMEFQLLERSYLKDDINNISPYFEDIHLIVFMFDITRAKTLKDILGQFYYTNNDNFTNIIKIIVANKIDLDDERAISYTQGLIQTEREGGYYEVSSKTGVGTRQLVNAIVNPIYEAIVNKNFDIRAVDHGKRTFKFHL